MSPRTVRVYDMNETRVIPVAVVIGNLAAIGRPDRAVSIDIQVADIGSIGIHYGEITASGKDDLVTDRSPVRLVVVGGIIGQPLLARSVRVHDVDLLAATVSIRAKNNVFVVRRPGGMPISR